MAVFPSFYGWIGFHWKYTPHFRYLFVPWWTLDYCRWCFNEHECRYFFDKVILFPLDIYPGVELLNNMIACRHVRMLALFLIFWATFILFSMFSVVTVQFTIPPTVHKASLFSTISPALIISCLSGKFSYLLMTVVLTGLRWYLIVVWFSFPYPSASFHGPVGLSYIFFGRMSLQVLYPFFNLGYYYYCCCDFGDLNHVSSSYILEIDSISEHDLQVFSPIP